MLTGRFQLAAPGDKLPAKTAVVLGFGASEPPDRATPLPGRRGAAWLPADDARAEVRYRDPTQMGKVYLSPAGVDRPVPGLGAPDQGPDADDPALTLEVWRERIRRHPGELKNLLRNQSFVAGHRQRLQRRDPARGAPAAVPQAGAASRPRRSTRSTRRRARRWRTRSRSCASACPPTFEKQVRDFLAVHDKGGQPCPRCGTRITEVRAGGFITSYCRGCQR